MMLDKKTLPGYITFHNKRAGIQSLPTHFKYD